MPELETTPPLEERVPWVAQVQKDLRGEDLAMSLNDFVKTSRETAKERDTLKARSPGLTIPGNDAKPEDVAAFNKALGVPENPDGYKFTGLPDGVVKPEDVKAFAVLAHKLHVPLAAAQELIAYETARGVAARTAYAEAQTKKTKEQADRLIQKYGVEKAREMAATRDRFLEQLGGQPLKDELNQSLENSPLLIDAVDKIAVLFTEKGITLSGTGGGAEKEVDLAQVYPKSAEQMGLKKK